MKVLHVVGARPNFMKAAPLITAMGFHPRHFEQVLVHTGQHYDKNMSSIFFDDLNVYPPDELLNVGSGSHSAQTAAIMVAFEPVLLKHKPDCVVVYGDVNSTFACALVCAKLGIQIAHVEAGLRSYDRTMPEEINRVLTDQISDFLFTPSRDADQNLLQEGIKPSKIHFVGNVMIDSLVKALPEAAKSSILQDLVLIPEHYVLTTLHRPSNVDHPRVLEEILTGLSEIGKQLPVIFPLHPRTRKKIRKFDMDHLTAHIRLLDPLGYLDFLALMNASRLVVTDSGGIQEETTFLGVSCLTVRANTERPLTVDLGTNRLVPSTCEGILAGFHNVMACPERKKCEIEFWDAKAAKRIVQIMLNENPGRQTATNYIDS